MRGRWTDTAVFVGPTARPGATYARSSTRRGFEWLTAAQHGSREASWCATPRGRYHGGRRARPMCTFICPPRPGLVTPWCAIRAVSRSPTAMCATTAGRPNNVFGAEDPEGAARAAGLAAARALLAPGREQREGADYTSLAALQRLQDEHYRQRWDAYSQPNSGRRPLNAAGSTAY